MTEAITIAEQANAGQLVAQIWVELVQITGAQSHRFEAAQANMRAAEAAFARVDPGPALRARYNYVVGAMLLARGKLDDARTSLDRALVALGASRPGERGVVHGALCDVSRQRREIEKAREHCQTAIDLLTQTFGPDHQKLGIVYNVWGTVELFAKQHAAAREKWNHAIAIFEARKLEADRGYALAFSNIAVSYSEQGDIEKARPLFERARDLFAKYHPDHVQATLPLQGLASVALQAKDYRAAIGAYESALAVIERVYGKDDERRITLLYNLALAYERLPDLEKAFTLTEEVRRVAEHPGRENWRMVAYALDMQAMLVERRSKDWKRAVAIRQHALTALDHADDASLRAWIEVEIGRVLRSDRQIAASIPHLERAVAYYTKDKTDLYVAGTSQFWLGKSLWETAGDRKRAVELVRAAGTALAEVKTGLHLDDHRTQVAAWLAAHSP